MLDANDKIKKTFESPRGAVFSLEVDQAGFYFFHMVNGGVRPDFCNKKFTTRAFAMRELDKYFRSKPKVTPRDEHLSRSTKKPKE